MPDDQVTEDSKGDSRTGDTAAQSFTIALCVATRGRHEALAPRLPVWTAAGFDEVVIVDGSYDPATRERIRERCERTGAKYVEAPILLRDTRALSRNLAAKKARTEWILFQDDDDDAVVSIDKEKLREAAAGRDWLAGPRGEVILLHRRTKFLEFGGYPEDMTNAEDWIMSNRARHHGAGGLEPDWYRGVATFPPLTEDPISRVRNAFWYGYTLLLFLVRCPRRSEVIVGDARRIAVQARRAVRRPRQWLYLLIGLVSRALSPAYCLQVMLRSGGQALRQEAYYDWQGLRPEA